MRTQSFDTFLYKHIKSLSSEHTANVSKLVELINKENYRLKEPLLIYVLVKKYDTYFRRVANPELCNEFDKIKTVYKDAPTFLSVMEKRESTEQNIFDDYYKLYSNYKYQANKPKNENELKEKLANQIMALQKTTGVSFYRISKEFELNQGNLFAFFKQKKLDRLSLANCRRIYKYLLNYQKMAS